MCLIHGRNSWKVSLNMVISLEVLYKEIPCSESCLTSSHGGTGVTVLKFQRSQFSIVTEEKN